MLNSYKISTGIAIMVCEKTSGVGAIIAPSTNARTRMDLRLAIRNEELITPSLASTKTINGSSKITPKGIKKEITNERYSPSEINGWRSSVENPKKNLSPVGSTKK